MSAREAFGKISRQTGKPKYPSPVTLRLTEDERKQLEEDAGAMTLSAYIRQRLFGGKVDKRKARRKKQIVQDEGLASQLLTALGRSKLANNLNQIARAVNSGSLPITIETEADLKEACHAVAAMRSNLIKALGLKV